MKFIDIFDAAEHDNEEAVKYFVEKKHAKLTDTDHRLSQTAAHIAAKRGNLNILKYVLDKEPDLVEAQDFYGNQIFFLAIENGHFNIVKYLAEQQLVDIREKNPICYGNTAIHRAAEYGHLTLLKYFVQQAGDVNVLNNFQQPPLFLAAEKRHQHIIRYLVEEEKANLTLIDHNKQNILYIAVTNEDLTLMRYVLDERKAPLDINWKDNFGDTLVHRAANLNKYKLLTYLVDEKHADMDTKDIWEQTPLHSAASQSHYAVCKFLLEHGANTEVANDRGRLPVHEAKDPRIIQMIKDASVKFTANHSTKQKKRNRRSLVEYFAPSQFLFSDRWTQMKINSDLYRSSRYVGNDTFSKTDDMNSFRLRTFLAIAGIIVRGAKTLKHEPADHSLQLSPLEILQNRMDSMAVESIEGGTYLQ